MESIQNPVNSKKPGWRRLAPLVLGLVLFAAPRARGEFAFLNLHNFSSASYGFLPQTGVVWGPDGNIYGPASEGGTNSAGTVYRVTPAGVATTIHSFQARTEGANPTTGFTVGTDGNLYGMTGLGGTNDAGAIFQMTLSGDVKVLHSFTDAEGGDRFFRGPVIQAPDGNLYGTTAYGGDFGAGIVYQLTPDGIFTILHTFKGGDEGRFPEDGVTPGPDGNLYGTTAGGGISCLTPFEGGGTVYRITPDGELTTLYEFSALVDGASPVAGLILGSDGNFYGTTAFGGNGYSPDYFCAGDGTLFKITPDGELTTLYYFEGGHDSGMNPQTRLSLGLDGNLYGATAPTTQFYMIYNLNNQHNDISQATIFQATPAGEVTTLHIFHDEGDGVDDGGQLAVGSDGNLYGATAGGGTNGDGGVFELSPKGEMEQLYSFPPFSLEGWQPLGSLIVGRDGNLYGTTQYGGTADLGAVIRVTPAGETTVLYSFTYKNDGGDPVAELTQGSDGNFYGTTCSGTANGEGGVFEITPAGALMSLYVFGDYGGEASRAGLVEDAAGNFYGTCIEGGLENLGIVFKIAPDGSVTILHSFPFYGGGSYPWGTLVRGKDGNLYGTTTQGGYNNNGTAFRITPDGDFTMLHQFMGGDDGATPSAGLMAGADGNFYGTTRDGGRTRTGTFFRMTPEGDVTMLYSFQGQAANDGAYPYSTPVQGRDGNFYGTTAQGGAANMGTIFQITPGGVETILHSFTGSGANDGQLPFCGLTVVTNNAGGSPLDFALYGMASAGGGGGHGTIFEVVPYVRAAPVFTSVGQSGGSLNLTWSSYPGGSYQLQASSILSPSAWSNVGAPVTATGMSLAFPDTINQPGRFYRVQWLNP